MAILDIICDTSPEVDGIAFGDSNNFIEWSCVGVYMALNGHNEHVFLVNWTDLDSLIIALKKAKELHELQQGGEK